MTISSDWLPDDIDLFGDDLVEEETERRALAWAVLVLLLSGIAATAINVVTAIFW